MLFDVLPVLYKMLGFNVKIELHSDLASAGFCSMTFDVETLTVVPEPMKKIMNFGWVSSRYKNASVRLRSELLRGKALSLLAESRGVPILQSMACAYIRLTQGSFYRIDDFWARQKMKNSNLNPLPVKMESRLLMERLHRFSVQEQLILEGYFDNLDDVGPIFHELLVERYTPEQILYWNFYVFDEDVGRNPYIPLPMIKFPSTFASFIADEFQE